jgi:peptidoglycan/LPS O-acetylase OafA/YrhL
VATTSVATSRPSKDLAFRGDVDGLRAIAILIVVAYHVGLPFAHGGFIGVDVFFVISGFLISRRLLREAETTDRVSLATFWARRIRRLVPAMTLMVVSTLAVGYFVMPVFDHGDLGRQGASASLYISNLVFASQSQNYFAANVSTSPFLHTWSLGVEEQFYLVWPVVFALVFMVALRTKLAPFRSRRRRLVTIFSALLVASFAYNVWLTNQGSPWSFYGLPTRAWEFAAAGILAAVPIPRSLQSGLRRTWLAIGGAVLLLAGLISIDQSTPYPGLAALLPVGATLLLILAGTSVGESDVPTPITQLLSIRPMQWLGRVSYSWYLWHWPAIVLLPLAFDTDSTAAKAVAALGALVVAAVVYKYYETPIRFASAIKSNRRTYLVGAAFTVVSLLLAVAVIRSAPDIAPVRNVDSTGPALVTTQGPPGASMNERLAAVVAQFRDEANTACPNNAVKTADGDDYCTGGDPNGTRSLLLLGDSHAGQWRAVLDAITRERGIRLVIRQHSGCPAGHFVGMSDPNVTVQPQICQAQQEGDDRVIRALHPDAVILAEWNGESDRIVDANFNKVDADQQAQIWQSGESTLVSSIVKQGIPLGVILDEPTLENDPTQCLSSKQTVSACEPDASSALRTAAKLLAIDRQIVRDNHLPSFDMTNQLCDASKCNLEQNGLLVYADLAHLAGAYTASLKPQITQLVGQVLP